MTNEEMREESMGELEEMETQEPINDVEEEEETTMDVAKDTVMKEVVGPIIRGELNKREMIKEVQLKMLMIGVGNAGNQTIAYARQEGMDVFAINTSTRDLNDIFVDEQIPCFIAGGDGRGSGKNIQKAISLFKENGRNLFQSELFIKMCQNVDMIIVTGATGGGTGSAIAPEVCRLLKSMFEKKIIIYHGIVPKNSDSNIAFSNSTYCLNEIKQLNIPYMLTDLECFATDPNDIAFIKADRHVVECAKAVSGRYLQMSSSQMIDENDLKSIISEAGYMGVYTVNKITSHNLEKHTMQSMMIQEIKNGAAVMIQKDGISMQMGSILSSPEDMMDTAKTGDYSELFQFIGHRPKNGIYENYSTTDGTDGHFTIILSGMTYPINRLAEYANIIKEQNEFLKKAKSIDTSSDAALVQELVSNPDDKLFGASQADPEKIHNVLDSYF